MDGNGADLKSMLEALVRSFVSQPERVSVAESQRAGTVILELRVEPSDLGKVIGREGRTARALRALLALAGEKTNLRVQLQIEE